MKAVKFFEIQDRFAMQRGHLISPTIAYETWGVLNAAGDNAVLVFTGLSPSAHAASSPTDPSAGWWEDMIGHGKPLDTDRYYIICINSLGSCFGSTGPASKNPETEKPYRLDFPVLTVEDIANSAAHVLEAQGIAQLHTVVGASMGGMTALAFALEQPGRCKRLVSISSAARALPHAIALRSLQREIIRKDPLWQNGQYDTKGDGPIIGMRLARKLGMISYRSGQEWAKRFGRERAPDFTESDTPFGIDFEVESYLESHANRFTGSFDANCYLYLSRAMDLFDGLDHGGSLTASFCSLQLDSAMVIGVSTDILFPLVQQQALADALAEKVADVAFVPLDSLQGHDSFLVDMDRFRPAMAAYF